MALYGWLFLDALNNLVNFVETSSCILIPFQIQSYHKLNLCVKQHLTKYWLGVGLIYSSIVDSNQLCSCFSFITIGAYSFCFQEGTRTWFKNRQLILEFDKVSLPILKSKIEIFVNSNCWLDMLFFSPIQQPKLFVGWEVPTTWSHTYYTSLGSTSRGEG